MSRSLKVSPQHIERVKLAVRRKGFLTGEKEVEIVSEDEGTLVKGRLDLLVFTPQFWILVIEAKGAKYSLEVGIPTEFSQ